MDTTNGSNWMIRHCVTPGCFIAIRERIGQQMVTPLCKWCQRGGSHAKLGKPAVDIRLKLEKLRA